MIGCLVQYVKICAYMLVRPRREHLIISLQQRSKYITGQSVYVPKTTRSKQYRYQSAAIAVPQEQQDNNDNLHR